jgi:hypothetical protein
MKVLIIVIAMLLSHTMLCQNEPGDQAVLMECTGAESPHKCTVAKFRDDVTQLLTPAIAAELRQAGKEYLFVSAVFVTDANGDLVPAETEVRCENLQIRKALLNYITKLPRFQPKDSHHTERRSVHTIDLSFLADETGSSYHVATISELWEKQLEPDYIKLDKVPVYDGCEGITDNSFDCLNIQIRNYLVQNYIVPDIEVEETMRIFVYFTVYKNGEIGVQKIEGGLEPFRNAVRKAILHMPKMIPGELRGIPVNFAFTLPFTINAE